MRSVLSSATRSLSLIIPLALAVSACGPRQTPAERVQAHTDRVLASIDATEAQQGTIKAAVADLTTTALATRAVHKETKSVVREQLTAAQADGAALGAQSAAVSAALKTTAHAFVDTAAIVHQTLDPAQRAALVDELKPGRVPLFAMKMAGRMGYGPPADETELSARMEQRLERGLDRIDATDAQRAALLPLARSLLAEAAPLFERKQALATALSTAWAADAFDATALHAMIDAELAPVDALLAQGAAAAVRAHAVLTSGQREQIATNMGSSDCETEVTAKNPRVKKAN